MANIKITDLTAYGNPTSTDVLPIVDVGADVTKKVSIADLLKNAASGTASAPGIAFDGDAGTGIYRPSANQLGIATGGSQALLIDTSGNVTAAGTSTADSFIPTSSSVPTNGMYLSATNSVAISTNGTGKLFVNADGRVGVSTTSPSAAFEVTGDAKIGDPSYKVRIAASSSTGVIEYPAASSRSVLRTLGATPLEFEINSSPVARIDSSGRLLVGTSSQSGGSLFQVNDDRIRIASSKTPASASDTGTAGEVCWDSSYIYVCTATDTWKRAALSTW